MEKVNDYKPMDDGINVYSFICDECKNVTGHMKCKAFPKRFTIPLEIWTGKNDHKTPYPGDNGIMFEPIEEINGTSNQ